MISHIISALLAFLTLFIAFVHTGEVFLLGLAILLLVFFAVVLIYNIILTKSLQIDISMKNSSVSNKNMLINIDISNPSPLPITNGIIKFRVSNPGFGVKDTFVKKFTAGSGTSSLVFELGSDYCGRFDVNIDHVRIYDLLGLSYKNAVKKYVKSVYLYPAFKPYDKVTEVRRVNYEKERYFSNRKSPVLSEILQYREYQPGDNLRHINWKLSDRYDELLVREFDTPTDNQVLITFDITNDNLKTKNMVFSTLMSVSSAYLKNGIFHQVGWYRGNKGTAFMNMFASADLYETMKMIFDDDKGEDTSGMMYLLKSGVLSKYAKVVYITNKQDDIMTREFVLHDNVEPVILDEVS